MNSAASGPRLPSPRGGTVSHLGGHPAIALLPLELVEERLSLNLGDSEPRTGGRREAERRGDFVLLFCDATDLLQEGVRNGALAHDVTAGREQGFGEGPRVADGGEHCGFLILEPTERLEQEGVRLAEPAGADVDDADPQVEARLFERPRYVKLRERCDGHRLRLRRNARRPRLAEPALYFKRDG